LTLRVRLLLAIFLVNLVVLGTLSALLYAQNARALDLAAKRFASTQWRPLLDDFVEQLPGESLSISSMLNFGGFEGLFRDVLLTDLPLVSDPEVVGVSEARHPYLMINPLGAAHRDPLGFPRDEILDGIRVAMDSREPVARASGFCLPIIAGDGQLVGGGWFLTHGAVEIERLPIGRLVIPIGLGILLLGGITFFGIHRWVLRPLEDLGHAARELEDGQAARVLRREANAQEFDRVFAAFNHASRLIHEHRQELEKAVDDATRRAQRRERELVLSQRLAALGTLAAGIAHEINNPLAGLLNASSRLRKTKDPERVELYLEMIEDGLERIRKIVSRTLDFAPRTTEAVSFAIADSVHRAQQLVAHRMSRSGVEFVVEGDGQHVRGDPHEMTQVFLNLMINSLDALEESQTPEPRIEVRIGDAFEEGEPFVEILVRDNGPGADPKTLQQVFDPFFSTKGATSKSESLSSGLGMSISYTIVEQHGGRISVESAPGEGFAVRILMPGPRVDEEGSST
jgi:signal transduction histidine kinase